MSTPNSSDAVRSAFDEVYGNTPSSDLQPEEADFNPADVTSTSGPNPGDFAAVLVLSDTERAILAGMHPQPLFEVESDPARGPVASLPPVFPGDEAASGLESERLLSPSVAAEWLGMTPGAMTQMRKRKVGPAYYKLGPTRTSPIRYMVRDLVFWREKNRNG